MKLWGEIVIEGSTMLWEGADFHFDWNEVAFKICEKMSGLNKEIFFPPALLKYKLKMYMFKIYNLVFYVTITISIASQPAQLVTQAAMLREGALTNGISALTRRDQREVIALCSLPHEEQEKAAI